MHSNTLQDADAKFMETDLTRTICQHMQPLVPVRNYKGDGGGLALLVRLSCISAVLSTHCAVQKRPNRKACSIVLKRRSSILSRREPVHRAPPLVAEKQTGATYFSANATSHGLFRLVIDPQTA